ncbi:MAG: hypothetical protein ACLR1T_12620 [Evtepia gabavorous]
MERILLYHCRALLMDEADTLLEGPMWLWRGDHLLRGHPASPGSL